MKNPPIWLRAETKPGERRTPLTPSGAEYLLETGFGVTVEDCPLRIFSIDEYSRAGCEIVGTGAWRHAPPDAVILGLKELPAASFPLTHRHIYFAHVYKDQMGWEVTLDRFIRGGGILYDLEYLTLENGRRIAAFGYWAGYCGAAFEEPCLEIIASDDPLHLIAIDHLPSLLPRESSEDYSEQLLPFLATLDDMEQGVWKRAYAIFADKTRGLRKAGAVKR